jgi:2-polyprenyl-3-methyl-5-hydroxy-6-metoxy-1,4-benzoquinol methylase
MSFFPRDLAAPAADAEPVVEWDEPDCLLCRGRRRTTLVEAPDNGPGGTGLWFAVVQCQQCGLCFTSPRPSKRTIGRFYPPLYAPHQLQRTARTQRPAARHRRVPHRHEIPWHGQGRLLDFGCGAGSFLERMHRQGWAVTGIDMCAPVVHRLRARSGFPVLAGSLPHPALAPHSFDVVTMWQSLEHVHDPLAVLEEAGRLLVPGGRLWVAVPNIDSLPFRWFGAAWYGLDLPRHLTHFTPWTLQVMLEQAGFRVGPVRMVRHSRWLRTSAAHAVRARRGPHWHRWLTRKPAARLATWYSYVTGQADCILVMAERSEHASSARG